MTLILKVTVDTNDGDYVSTETSLDNFQPAEVETVQLIAEAIMANGGKWSNGDMMREDPRVTYAGQFTEEQIVLFDEEFTPYAEYGFHSVVGIELREVTVLRKF